VFANEVSSLSPTFNHTRDSLLIVFNLVFFGQGDSLPGTIQTPESAVARVLLQNPEILAARQIIREAP